MAGTRACHEILPHTRKHWRSQWHPALIIFVTLAIVLGVTAFVYHGKYADALVAADASRKVAQSAVSEVANKDAECGELKRMIGTAESPLADIRHGFDTDMKDYGSNFPEGNRFYKPILKSMAAALESKSGEIKDLNDKLADLDRKFGGREGSHQAEIKRLAAAAAAAAEDLLKVTKAYEAERARIQESLDDLAKQWADTRKKTAKTLETKDEAVKAFEAKLADAQKVIREEAATIKSLTRPTMDVAAGEIRRVDQHEKMAWINLGRADLLPSRASFSVYGADSADLGKAVKKASIEVTKILDDHSAECRILEDKISDPILPGDKIHTPLWTPGEPVHFALAGVMDLDGDGRDALDTVRNLITISGGAIDCQYDGKGKITGEMNSRTRYLVLGDEPGAKGHPEAILSYKRLIGDADRLGVGKMTLAELKQKMGYKK